MDFCLGFDFFISYAWKDGRTYALALEAALKDHGFECFLDSKHYAKGDDWRLVGRMALRRTSRLILVCTPAALESEPVLREVERFSRLNRRIIPISFDGSLTPETERPNPLSAFVTRDHLNIPESSGRMTVGPTEATVKSVVETFDLLRQDRWRVRVFAGAAAVFFALAVAAVIVGILAVLERRLAERRERIAVGQGLAALAENSVMVFPQRGTLLAVSALEVTERLGEPRVAAAEQALRNALGTISGRPLSGHTGPIRCLLISPSGKTALTASDDATVRVWDLENPRATARVLQGHSPPVRCMVLAPDGRTLIAGSADSTARVWDLAVPAAAPRVLEGHEDGITAMTVTADGRTLITASQDSTARAWDLRSLNSPARVFRGHERPVRTVQAIPRSRRFATFGDDTTGRIWDLDHPDSAPAVLNTIEPRGANILAVSPDGQWLVTGGPESRLKAWRLSTGTAITSIPLGDNVPKALAAAFDPESSELATACNDGSIRLWIVSEFNQYSGALPLKPKELTGHTGEVTSLCYSPSGQFLASTGGDVTEPVFLVDGVAHQKVGTDSTVRVWNLYDRQAKTTVLRGHEGTVHHVVFSPDGNRLLSGGEDGIARVWDVKPEEPISRSSNFQSPFERRLPDRGGVSPVLIRAYSDRTSIFDVAVALEGCTLATSAHDGHIGIWRVADEFAAPELLRSCEFKGPARIAFSPEGEKLFITSRSEMLRWSWRNDPRPEPIAPGRAVPDDHLPPFWSANGVWVAAIGQEPETLHLYDLTSPGRAPLALPNRLGVLYTLLSDDGRYVLGLSDDTKQNAVDRRLVVWDRSKPAQPPRVLPWTGSARPIAVSRNGRLVVSAERDQVAALLDVSRNDRPVAIRLLDAHEGGVATAAFRPDGRVLVTAGSKQDRTIRLWDLARPEEEPIGLNQDYGEIGQVQFSEDARWLVVVYAKGTLGLWHAATHDLVRLGREVAGRELSERESRRYLPAR
jgi:WD40 repeat protein